MNLYKGALSVRFSSRASNKSILTVLLLVFILGLPVLKAFAQQPDKIQQAVNSIKETYHNEDDDYITDGQRTVWVKSYKKWEPADLIVMQKESPSTLRFLGMAAQRARYDVLEQLLPDYYRKHGGVKTFAADVLKEQVTTISPAGKG